MNRFMGFLLRALSVLVPIALLLFLAQRVTPLHVYRELAVSEVLTMNQIIRTNIAER